MDQEIKQEEPKVTQKSVNPRWAYFTIAIAVAAGLTTGGVYAYENGLLLKEARASSTIITSSCPMSEASMAAMTADCCSGESAEALVSKVVTEAACCSGDGECSGDCSSGEAGDTMAKIANEAACCSEDGECSGECSDEKPAGDCCSTEETLTTTKAI